MPIHGTPVVYLEDKQNIQIFNYIFGDVFRFVLKIEHIPNIDSAVMSGLNGRSEFKKKKEKKKACSALLLLIYWV